MGDINYTLDDFRDIFREKFFSCNTYDKWRGGPPLHILDELSEEELSAAEDELISALSLSDTAPIIGLGYIRSQKALPALYDLLLEADSKEKKLLRITIAHSIFQICGDKNMCEVVLQALTPLVSWGGDSANEIIHMLPNFNDTRITEKLHEFYEQGNSSVSANAEAALIKGNDPISKRRAKRRAVSVKFRNVVSFIGKNRLLWYSAIFCLFFMYQILNYHSCI
ncbi:MAG: hypothetical protein LBL82_02295 [Oscillospiraceae bacterium]|nr:hypothetical protein [Oscillospiraceae bacterium]